VGNFIFTCSVYTSFFYDLYDNGSVMAITWKILSMDRFATANDNADVVTNVFWYASDSDDQGNYGFCYGNTQLNSTSATFVNYTQLTEAQVVQWVKDDLAASTPIIGGPNELEIVETCITDGIANRQFTLRYQGVPW